MGQWSLISATPAISNRNDVYGHYFAITFRLKYSSSMIGSFSETPALQWKETITLVERTAGTYWFAEFDQFQRLPDSPTFGDWVYRYILAYGSVAAGDYSDRQSSRLYDKHGAQLPTTTFAKVSSSKDRADAVRSYLKKNGGIMSVTVRDTPGINKPTDATVDKFRILTFDCGLQGFEPRIRAVQHLTVKGISEATWSRDCALGSISKPYSTAGIVKTAAPANVTEVKPFTGGPGGGTYM